MPSGEPEQVTGKAGSQAATQPIRFTRKDLFPMRYAIRTTQQLHADLGNTKRAALEDMIDQAHDRIPELEGIPSEITWEFFIPGRRADPLSIECVIPVSDSPEPEDGQVDNAFFKDLKKCLELALGSGLEQLVVEGFLDKPVVGDAYGVSVFKNPGGRYYRFVMSNHAT